MECCFESIGKALERLSHAGVVEQEVNDIRKKYESLMDTWKSQTLPESQLGQLGQTALHLLMDATWLEETKLVEGDFSLNAAEEGAIPEKWAMLKENYILPYTQILASPEMLSEDLEDLLHWRSGNVVFTFATAVEDVFTSEHSYWKEDEHCTNHVGLYSFAAHQCQMTRRNKETDFTGSSSLYALLMELQCHMRKFHMLQRQIALTSQQIDSTNDSPTAAMGAAKKSLYSRRAYYIQQRQTTLLHCRHLLAVFKTNVESIGNGWSAAQLEEEVAALESAVI